MLDLITGIYKAGEWRDYVTKGAGAFSLDVVKRLFQATYKNADGTVDLEALRNKAMALVMIICGGHPIDIYRMEDEDVEDRPNHRDRMQWHRPKIIIRGEHTKRPWNVRNTLGCGCEGHHEIDNEFCLYNIMKLY